MIREELNNIKPLSESFDKIDIAKFKAAIESHGKLIGLGDILKKQGYKTTFTTEPIPMLRIEKGSSKYALLNKKYADDPDFVVGEIAGGEL